MPLFTVAQAMLLAKASCIAFEEQSGLFCIKSSTSALVSILALAMTG